MQCLELPTACHVAWNGNLSLGFFIFFSICVAILYLFLCNGKVYLLGAAWKMGVSKGIPLEGGSTADEVWFPYLMHFTQIHRSLFSWKGWTFLHTSWMNGSSNPCKKFVQVCWTTYKQVGRRIGLSTFSQKYVWVWIDFFNKNLSTHKVGCGTLGLGDGNVTWL